MCQTLSKYKFHSSCRKKKLRLLLFPLQRGHKKWMNANRKSVAAMIIMTNIVVWNLTFRGVEANVEKGNWEVNIEIEISEFPLSRCVKPFNKHRHLSHTRTVNRLSNKEHNLWTSNKNSERIQKKHRILLNARMFHWKQIRTEMLFWLHVRFCLRFGLKASKNKLGFKHSNVNVFWVYHQKCHLSPSFSLVEWKSNNCQSYPSF